MKKIIIFGNSGSGKSTLATVLRDKHGLAHLDLDSLAWQPQLPPERRPLTQSAGAIADFIDANDGWVIEGCYSDLLETAILASNELIFLNLSTDACIRNARNRPWEPHKYASKTAQDANLVMLIAWISEYPQRSDTFSQSEHRRLYNDYPGIKRMYTSNDRKP